MYESYFYFSAKADAKLDIQIPELPLSPEKKPREKADKAKPNRHLIEAQDEFDFFKPDPTVSLHSHTRCFSQHFGYIHQPQELGIFHVVL